MTSRLPTMESSPAAPSPFWLLDPASPWPAALLAGLLLLVTLFFVVWWRSRRSKLEVPRAPPVIREFDVTRLPEPPSSGHAGLSVEVYGTPVRIAVFVLAPVGRDGALPEPDQIPGLIDQLVPGFAEAVLRDQPLVRVWEGQLSSQGFANAFFQYVPLPGDRGKGTPWCSLVGKFTAEGHPFLVGLVCRSGTSNALSQYVMQHEGQWNDVLRVRRAGPRGEPL